MEINEKDIVWDDEVKKEVLQKMPPLNESDIIWDDLPQADTAINQNPFVQSNQDDYNNQVHTMDMDAINEANKPKSFLETVKDFGSNVLKNFTQPVKEIGLPIASATEELTNSFLPESLQTDVIPDLPSKTKDTRKSIDSSTIDAIESIPRTDIRLMGEATEEQKNHYVDTLSKVVNLGGYNLVQLQDGQYKAQNKEGTILDLNEGTIDSILRGIKADKFEIAGDLGGLAIAGKIASNLPGGPMKKLATTVGGAALGGMIGNQADNILSSLKTGEVLNFADSINELSKAGVLSVGGNLGGDIAAKTIGSAVDGAKYIKENGLPIGEDKLAQKFVDTKTNINSPENLENAQISKDFGAKDTKLLQLADEGNAEKAMSDMFENNKEMRESVLKDHETLTNNLYTNGNITKLQNNEAENVNDLMGGLVEDQVKGIDSVYKKVYGEYKDDIVEIFGDKALNVTPKTAAIVKDKINMLNIGENAGGDIVEKSAKQLDETYAGILDIAKTAFTDADGQYINKFKISKMMDLNKELNEYSKLHKDKLTPKHFEVIRDIRSAIDEDIINYADVALDSNSGKIVKDKWKEINSGYSDWLFGIGKDGNKLDKLLQDTSNIKTLATDMVGAGTIKNEYLETFGDIAQHLKKTNPNALIDLQDTVVNAIMQPITVKQKFDGKTYEFVDFDMFDKMFDEKTISTKGLNKIFGGTKEGQQKLDTLKAFRKIAADERKIQNAIYKNQSPLSEAGQKAVETKRTFLFGVKYFFTRTIVNAMASKVIPSVAYDKMIVDLSSKQRYTLKDFDSVARKIEKSPEYKSFTPDEKIYLKNLRTQAEEFEKNSQEETARQVSESLKKNEQINQQQMLERLKQEADDRIKNNMLLEHKAIIPPVQIKEGAKEPLGLDIQDRISVQNTKQPSTKPVEQKETTFNDFITRFGIDKNKIISSVETKKQFEELMKSPYFDEVVSNGQSTYAKDSKYAFTKDGQDKYIPEDFAGQGNENGYNKIPANYTPNDMFGTVFTKQDYNNLQKGNITEELVNKLKLEIGEREQADLLAKQDFEKESNLKVENPENLDFFKILEDANNKGMNVTNSEPMTNELRTKIKNNISELNNKKYKENNKKVDYNENTQQITGNISSTIGNINANKKRRTLEQYSTQLDLLDNIEYFIKNNTIDNLSNDTIENFLNLVTNRTILKGENPAKDLVEFSKFNLEQIDKAIKSSYTDLEKDFFKSLKFDKQFEQAEASGAIPFSNPVVGGASVGAASGTQTDFNQDGKIDEVDVMIGTLIGTIGIKATMAKFPKYFK